VNADVVHARLPVADVVLEAAGQLVGVWQRHVRRDDDSDEDDEATGGLQHPQVSRRLAGAVEHKLVDALPLRLLGSAGVLVGPRGDGLFERLQVCVHVLDAGVVAQRRLDALGDVVRIADRNVCGQLQVQGEADEAVVLEMVMSWASRWRNGR
jgi:hypothetical protein